MFFINKLKSDQDIVQKGIVWENKISLSPVFPITLGFRSPLIS